ncbi:MAG: protein-disulfide reductase DsbD domain-containing protein [Bacteroidota bacterium]
MKKILTLALVLFAIVNCSLAQTQDAVKWNYSVEQTNSTEATLVFKANIDEGWHIYSQFTPDGGPLPTVFTIAENGCFTVDGKVSEPAAHREFDKTFGVDVLTLEGKPTFVQKIKLKEGDCIIKGRVDGQVCKDVCIMFGADFTFNIGKSKDDGIIKN